MPAMGSAPRRAYRHFAAEYRRLTGRPAQRRCVSARRRPPPLGAPIVQPELARTLEEIAAEGAESFYRGGLARRIAAASQAPARWSARAISPNSWPSGKSRSRSITAVYTVLEAPPNSTGFVLLQELKIVENFDLGRMGLVSADSVHALVEAKKLAFADRERWGADPRTH